jgi:hypothetical protein
MHLEPELLGCDGVRSRDPHIYNPFSIVGLQTNNTLFVVDSVFIAKEEDVLRDTGFLAKDREQLSTAYPIKFNSSLIKLDSDFIFLM